VVNRAWLSPYKKPSGAYMLIIDEIDPTLAYPGFWTQKKLIFLLAIKKVCPQKIVREKDLIPIKKAIEKEFNARFACYGHNEKIILYRFTQKDYLECNDVLEHLQNHNWSCAFFDRLKKVERPNLLPSQVKKYEDAATIQKERNQFWSKNKVPIKNLLRALIIEVTISTGLPFVIVSKALTLPAEIHKKGFLCVPIAEGSSRTVYYPLTTRAALLFEYAKKNLESFKIEEIDSDDPISSGSLVPYLAGVESVLFAQLQRKQLPVPLPLKTHKSPVVFRYLKKDFEEQNGMSSHYPLLIKRMRENQIFFPDKKEKEPLIELNYDDRHLEDTLNWCHESLITISSIKSELKKSLTDKSGTYYNGKVDSHIVEGVLKNAFQDTINRVEERALAKATAITKPIVESDLARLKNSANETALAVALSYIHHQLCERKNTLETCLLVINQIFERGLLRYPAFNLNSWDEEDIEVVLSDYMLERKNNWLSASTQYSITLTFKRVIRFCKTLHIFRHIELPDIEPSGVVITKRNHIVGLREFDLIKAGETPFLYLAFYGGLRSGEAARLMMSDVVSIKDELTIYVRQGKTPAAKRAIPLHLIAPPKIIKVIQDYYETRKSYYRAYAKKATRNKKALLKLNEAAFLNFNIQSFSSSSGTLVAREALTRLQSQLGNAANLHLLRHSFASHMFLRWYCCKYPELVNELVDEKHWCFSKTGLDKLRIFFGEEPGKPLPDSNTTAIIHLIKLMGHRNTNTLFQVYVHSFYDVLNHALKRVNNKLDEVEPSDKLIATLVIPPQNHGGYL